MPHREMNPSNMIMDNILALMEKRLNMEKLSWRRTRSADGTTVLAGCQKQGKARASCSAGMIPAAFTQETMTF